MNSALDKDYKYHDINTKQAMSRKSVKERLDDAFPVHPALKCNFLCEH